MLIAFSNARFQACQGIPGIYVTRVAPVPNSEVYHLFSVRSRTPEISEGMWARIKGGNYKGDLAQVLHDCTINVFVFNFLYNL